MFLRWFKIFKQLQWTFFSKSKPVNLKNKISYFLKCTHKCAFQEVRNISFTNVRFTMELLGLLITNFDIFIKAKFSKSVWKF